MNASTKSCLHVAFHEMTLLLPYEVSGDRRRSYHQNFLKVTKGKRKSWIGLSSLRICVCDSAFGLGVGLLAGRSHKHYSLQERRPRALWLPRSILREPRWAPAGARSVLPHSCVHQSRNTQGDRLVGCKTQWSTRTEVMDWGTNSVTHKSLSPVPRILSYAWKNKVTGIETQPP